MGSPDMKQLGPWLGMACVLLAATTLCNSVSTTMPKTYVVQMDKSQIPESFTHHFDWYHSTLRSVIASEPETDANTETTSHRILYHYDNAFHGFAAKLTGEEAQKLESVHGVVALYPEVMYHLHTTRSPEFLRIIPTNNKTGGNIWAKIASSHQVVVGILDTGIWPESPSFRDLQMAPPPAGWNGRCEASPDFTPEVNCNKKVIGARVFYRGYEAATGSMNDTGEVKSARDHDGHGTHTAATVAGAPVPNASLLGYANGTARGMAPGVRIAVYKVCWANGCFSSDILSAIDRAVADGVHVLSISLGGGVSSYYRDSLAVAAFGAMEKRVFVSCSAGNAGPDPVSLTNVSPWIATVGASTMDRDFPSTVTLGNKRSFHGVSLYKGRRNLSRNKQYPLVYLTGNSSTPEPSSLCLTGTLDSRKVAGKIVICDRGISPRVEKGQVVKEAGGMGMILANTAANGEELVADAHLISAVSVGETAGKAIKHYVSTTFRPTGTLSFIGTKLGIRPAPVVAAFSSRGPNFLTLEILKPDMVAPGVNILAAWSGDAPPSSLQQDRRRVAFNILSGTSMSCPHVSGVAALLKAAHPDWSPAAIKSALMTTAYVHDNTHGSLRDAATDKPSTHFDHGAGHINPSRALDPGLIYDINPQDYYEFLCSVKLTPEQLKVFSKSTNQTCRHAFRTPSDLNYPAISAVFAEKPVTSTVSVRRTVTNVGSPVSTYRVRIAPIVGADVIVKPRTLNFTEKYQKLSYEVIFTSKSQQTSPALGALVWTDGIHKVRSPIVLTWLAPI
ncbi:hypothetical protein AMTRI_Chr09g22320 [Amborella trichopoda]|uniref:Subtilisin-like protease n=1 Tax=Amborella trichopoda TaxID=13333 RepID=U5DDE5_AMBTC|nr:subtilisin-like protease SBT1.3 [Amborella trichopoda]ERN19452.1 hypothetical protein AMTR_s00069p00181050 [Amborella trichopoda]|eukprot:XP_006857985.3 subtilisin-like protease SBT1.3 [Amborella trichopoda]